MRHCNTLLPERASLNSGLAISAALGLVLLSGGCSQPTSELYVAAPDATFTELDDNGTVSAAFEVVNRSSDVVEITGTTVSCGCSHLELSANVIEPGNSITATFIADVHDRIGNAWFTAVLSTNSPRVPELHIRMSGTIRANKLDGAIVFDIGRFLPGADIDEVITLSKTGFPDATLSVVSSDEIRAEVLRQNVEPVKFKIRLRGTSPVARGEFERTVDVEASRYIWENATLSARGVVLDRWDVPSDAFMGLVPRHASRTETVEIRDRFPELGRPGRLPVASVGNKSLSATCRFDAGGAIMLDLELQHTQSGPVEIPVDLLFPGTHNEAHTVVVHALGE